MFITSCKLDKVPPDSLTAPSDDDTVLGITVIAKKVSDSYLTSAWKVQLTVLEYYDDNNIVVSGTATSSVFSGVIINDNIKSLVYANPQANVNSSGTYVLSLSDNVLFMQLSADPFGRSSNTPIRITRLNAASMVWVAIDQQTTLVNSQQVHKAYRIVFYK